MKEIGSKGSSAFQDHNFGSHLQVFQNLMHHRIRDIILVSSPYDLYLFEEDGRLYELIRDEYKGLNLSHSPELTRVSSGKEALKLASTDKRFDLIITTPHIDDMDVIAFAKLVKESELHIPIVLLAYDNREMASVVSSFNNSLFHRAFVWQGDFRILVGIIKHVEDHMNVDHDTAMVGVQTVILVEDSVRYYSSFLPIIYTELLKQSMRLISEGINLSDRYLRMRARPKILLATNYEEAQHFLTKYEDNILGIISDVDFKRDGKQNPKAGLEFAREVKKFREDIPILLQSNRATNKAKAHDLGASFLLKDSPTFLGDLRRFMVEQFSFGEFIFKTPDGKEAGRAQDLLSLEQQLYVIPEESLEYHAAGNHFSNWLKARTEFWLAHKLRPKKLSQYQSVNDLRQDLIASLRSYRKLRQRGTITDFRKESFDPQNSFARIGGGSLGGKARGLSFVNLTLNNPRIREKLDKFENISIQVPPGVVLGTDIFDYFVDENDLRTFALSATNDEEIIKRFMVGMRFPDEVLRQLAQFLDLIRTPLAVRSSSLLEDSQYHPFAGVYDTYMLPNNHHNANVRLHELLNAIKCVYASIFYQRTKDYMKITSYRLEEEKMAVIIQKMIGTSHENRFYPDFSGVARSHNFYPIKPQSADDGIISMALGLGQTVVEGGKTIKFSPKHPRHIPLFYNIDHALKNGQQKFYALNLDVKLDKNIVSYNNLLKTYDINTAEADGTLAHVGSTYSHENHAIYDGISRDGARLVSFAPILKQKIFPLPEILDLLLKLGRKGMGSPVEIEFAVNMSPRHGHPLEFGVLQMRPMVINRELEQLDVEHGDSASLLCHSNMVLGNGLIDNLHDVVIVDYETYERSRSRQVANEVYHFNNKLVAEDRPYLLIGVGRWGSMDPWLGIPVKWEQISGARVIIESSFKDFEVMPSQGSHFFQNITSFMTGYFTITSQAEASIDWEWLTAQKAVESMQYTRHLRFKNPFTVKMNGHRQKGIIIKPEA